jgi:hypothetical protein
MDSDADIWRKAHEAWDSGDPAPLFTLLLLAAPPIAQEATAARLAKVKIPKPPSLEVEKLARATVHFWKREPEVGYRLALDEAAKRFALKNPKALPNAVAKNRHDVNEAIKLLNLVAIE